VWYIKKARDVEAVPMKTWKLPLLWDLRDNGAVLFSGVWFFFILSTIADIGSI